MPDPFLSWTDTRFPSYIMTEVANAKYEKPSPIQALGNNPFPLILFLHVISHG